MKLAILFKIYLTVLFIYWIELILNFKRIKRLNEKISSSWDQTYNALQTYYKYHNNNNNYNLNFWSLLSNHVCIFIKKLVNIFN